MEKFCLQQDAFQKNIMKEIQDLRQNEDFSDVTLVLEDGSMIPAHKMILAMSSSFFKETQNLVLKLQPQLTKLLIWVCPHYTFKHVQKRLQQLQRTKVA